MRTLLLGPDSYKYLYSWVDELGVPVSRVVEKVANDSGQIEMPLKLLETAFHLTIQHL